MKTILDTCIRTNIPNVHINKIDALGVYIHGEYAGVSNEEAVDLIEMAINEGIKMNNGQKNIMSIALGKIWLEGYMAGCEANDENVKQTLRNSIDKYYFI